LKLNDFIIIKANPSQKNSKAILKDQQNKRDLIQTFPPEVQHQMRQLKEENNINQKELLKIKQIVNSMDIKQHEIEIKLNEITFQVIQESNQEKLIDHFRKSFSKFNDIISDDLLELNKESKDEVKHKFTQLTDLMNDYQEKL